MLAKAGGAVDEPLQADDLADFVQIADARLELGQRVDRALPGRRVALVDRQLAADPPRMQKLVSDPGQLARGNDQVAGPQDGDIRADSGRGWRQLDAQFFQGCFDFAHGKACDVLPGVLVLSSRRISRRYDDFDTNPKRKRGGYDRVPSRVPTLAWTISG